MDGINQSAYILPPMNRLFLAFMALLAGLLAQGGPAQARDCAPGASQVGAVQAPVAQASVASQAQQAISGALRSDKPADTAKSAVASLQTVLTPTVHIGIDRARE
jgi:hypothetical protein